MRRRRGRHGPRPDILLTEDQANIVMMALADAEHYRRSYAHGPYRDQDLARARQYRQVAGEVADVMPEPPPGQVIP